MTERPILFGALMVRALLDGRKTQTRRVVKPKHTQFFEQSAQDILGQWGDRPLPYGQTGDRLWVRENGWERPERTPRMMRDGADTWAPYCYDADGYDNDADREQFREWGFRRRPSIYMPRWASRITLEITGVRVEWLQDISEADAISEGVTFSHPVKPSRAERMGRDAYICLWESINGPGSWDKNPWVWVVEFRRLP